MNKKPYELQLYELRANTLPQRTLFGKLGTLALRVGGIVTAADAVVAVSSAEVFTQDDLSKYMMYGFGGVMAFTAAVCFGTERSVRKAHERRLEGHAIAAELAATQQTAIANNLIAQQESNPNLPIYNPNLCSGILDSGEVDDHSLGEPVYQIYNPNKSSIAQ